MQRIIIAAACLLMIQLVLVAALGFNRNTYEGSTPSSQFLDFDIDNLSSLTLTDGQGSEVAMTKADGLWVLSNHFSAQAEQQMVSGLLQKLAELKQGFVIATSAAAAKRFKVAEDDFERRLRLYQGEEVVADVYLGSSPGFRQIHARKSGQDEIVTVSLSSFEVEADPANWLDKNILKKDEKELSHIVFKDFTLKRENDTWQLEGLTEAEKVVAAELDQVVDKVLGITVSSVLDPKEVSQKFTSEADEVTFSLKKKDGTEISYSLVKLGEDRFGVKASDNELYYLINSLLVENLKKISRETLLAKEEPEDVEQAETVK